MNKTILEHDFEIGDVVYIRRGDNEVIKAGVSSLEFHIKNSNTRLHYKFVIIDEEGDESTLLVGEENVFATADEAFG